MEGEVGLTNPRIKKTTPRSTKALATALTTLFPGGNKALTAAIQTLLVFIASILPSQEKEKPIHLRRTGLENQTFRA